MFHRTLELVKGEFSGGRAFRHVEEVVRHHRIQASPGFRDAANYCLSAFQKDGIESEVISYPADGTTQFWSQIMMQEWSCDMGELKLIEPESKLLASYDACKISLIQRSGPTPEGGVTAEVFLLDKGDDAAPYADVDLKGKIVFTDGDINKVRKWAVDEKGALGIISDRLTEFAPVRHRYDIPDALQYTSFWWAAGDKPCFGFVLSPKAGDGLRRLCKQMAARHAQDPTAKPAPVVHAEVKASFYSGAIENAIGFVPGETDEEILVVAHLCHPQWSANDNASGVSVALETARTLKVLIDSGKLARPKRGIRFLLPPEMTGTYAYLATEEARAKRTLAGVNLDMVGERQELCKGPLIAEHPPEATESFVGDLIESIMQEVGKEVKNLGGSAKYALFKHTATPFSGGSDHYILSDPTVNVPCPMVIQWPDKYYHTSEDTIDKVDPEMLYRVGAITATYAYSLACFGLKEVVWMGGESMARFQSKVAAYVQEQLAAMNAAPEKAGQLLGTTQEQLAFRLERRKNQLNSLNRFLSPAEQAQWQDTQTLLMTEAEQAVAAGLNRLSALLAAQGIDAAVPAAEVVEPVEGEELVPVRLVPGPLSMRGHVERLSEEEQERYRNMSKEFGADALRTTTCALYWADGQRNIKEICALVKQEMGVSNVAFMVAFMRALATMGFVELK